MRAFPCSFLPTDNSPGRAGAQQSCCCCSSSSSRSQTLNTKHKEGFHSSGITVEYGNGIFPSIAPAGGSVTTRLTNVVATNGGVGLCLGQHGAVCHPGGGERGLRGRGFETQPAAMLERRAGVEHAASELGGHSRREQVGLKQVLVVGHQLKICPFFVFLVPSLAMFLPWPVRTGFCRCSPPAGDACSQPSS